MGFTLVVALKASGSMENVVSNTIANVDGVNCGIIAAIRVLAQVRTSLKLGSHLSADLFAALLERNADKLVDNQAIDVGAVRAAWLTPTFAAHPVRRILQSANAHDGHLDAGELLALYARTADNDMELGTLVTTATSCSACGHSAVKHDKVEDLLQMHQLVDIWDTNGHGKPIYPAGACPKCSAVGTACSMSSLRPARLILVQLPPHDILPTSKHCPLRIQLPGNRLYKRTAGAVHSPGHWRSLHAREDATHLCGSNGTEAEMASNALKVPGWDVIVMAYILDAPVVARTASPATPTPAQTPAAPSSQQQPVVREPARELAGRQPTSRRPASLQAAPRQAAPREAAPRQAAPRQAAPRQAATREPQPRQPTAPTPSQPGTLVFARWTSKASPVNEHLLQASGAIRVSRPRDSWRRKFCFLQFANAAAASRALGKQRVTASGIFVHLESANGTGYAGRFVSGRAVPPKKKDKPYTPGPGPAPLHTPGPMSYAHAVQPPPQPTPAAEPPPLQPSPDLWAVELQRCIQACADAQQQVSSLASSLASALSARSGSPLGFPKGDAPIAQ